MCNFKIKFTLIVFLTFFNYSFLMIQSQLDRLSHAHHLELKSTTEYMFFSFNQIGVGVLFPEAFGNESSISRKEGRPTRDEPGVIISHF